MLKALTLSQIYVLDQDEALDFYVGKLGMEVRDDYDLGFMRWLTVGLPGDNRFVLLELTEQQWRDEESNRAVRELVTRGAAGGWLGFNTDDAQQMLDDLVAKGVEVTDPVTQRFYGTDFGIRDPFGNLIRITQLSDVIGDPAQDPNVRPPEVNA